MATTTTTTNSNTQEKVSKDEQTESKSESSPPEQHNASSSLRERAAHFRESVHDHYTEFRQNPRGTTVSGAKSLGGMIKQYGPVFIGTYMGVYLTTLGSFYLGVQSGVLDPIVLFQQLKITEVEAASSVQLVVSFMEQHDITKPYAHIVEQNPYMANFAIAWIAVKFTEPVRLPVALAITPRVARWLGYSKKAE